MFTRLTFVVLMAISATLPVLSALADVNLVRRQSGSQQCNIDRLYTIVNLDMTISDVKSLQSAGSSDPSVASAAASALSGLNTAQSAVQTIVQAILQGQTAPPDARGQVEQGLNVTGTALASINSTDTSVISALNKAVTDLTITGLAGDAVLTNCN